MVEDILLTAEKVLGENKLCASEDKIWGKFCNERCKIKEKCLLELVDEVECPIATQIVELDYVKKTV